LLALIQFDAASLQIVERMLTEGRLPALAEIRRRGEWRTLDAAATILQSSTYPTLYTGVDVRKHGIYSTFPWSPKDQRVRFAHTFDKPKTIWERLTEAGSSSLVVDPYLSWAPKSMAGAFLSGVHFEDRMVMRSRSVPRALMSSLYARHGRAPRLHDVYGTQRVTSLEHLRDELVAAPKRAAALVVDQITSQSFDVLWLNFAASHKAGHHLWNPAAAVEESLTEERADAIRRGLEEIYVSIDIAMSRVLEALPPSSDVIVFSPTGMSANTSRADLLPRMLDSVLNPKSPSASISASRSRAPVWRIRSAIPVAWRSRIADALPERLVADLTTRLHAQAAWSRTRAFVIPGDNKGYIRLNMKGREREGIVESGEVKKLVASITEGLMTFKDPDGAPAVERVETIQTLSKNEPHSPLLPDLVVFWGENFPVPLPGVSSHLYGNVVRNGVGSGRSGNHVDDAWAVIAPGTSRVRKMSRESRITDIGATACAMFGADMTGLSGESLLEPHSI
jgi:predicted AlkP superfamily phosphohydrolase/phosphomutase